MRQAQGLSPRLRRFGSPTGIRTRKTPLVRIERLEERALLSTFTVNTTSDENSASAVPGDLSLREAIIQANATPGPNTIIVPAGTYRLTIAGSGEDAGQTGDLDITQSVTIQGAGAGATVIDGNGLDRVLHIVGTGAASTVVNLSGVTIQGGQTPNGTYNTIAGGGIEVYAATLNVDQCVVQNNRTGGGSYGGNGGGIDVTLGTLSVTHSTITANATGTGTTMGGHGGGIAGLYASITVTDSTISNNATGAAPSTSAGRGGGVFCESGGPEAYLTITGSTISGNTSGTTLSSGEGGGIYNYVNSTLVLENSLVTGNSTSYYGGGIANDNGTIDHITNSTISNNTAAQQGGGLYNEGSPTVSPGNGMINLISGTTIAGNRVPTASAGYNGGSGIYNQGSGNTIATIVNSTITGNSTNSLGGGICNLTNIGTIINTTIAGNTAAEAGGLFHMTYANASPVIGSVVNTIIAGNTAAAGQPQDFEKRGTVTTVSNDLVQDPTGNGLASGSNGNLVGLDPQLGPLASNGGPTWTMALLAGSPAIDAGTSTGAPATDQRGLPRPAGSAVDIGAFELQTASGTGPVAAGQSDTAFENTPYSGKATANDADGDTLSYSVVVPPLHGSVTMQPDGAFVYTPAPNYYGSDSFAFEASDGTQSSNAATVLLTVVAPPAARNDGFAVAVGGTLNVAAPGVLGNDSDPNGLKIAPSVVAGPAGGSLALNADGSFTYTPNPGFRGIDSFQYKDNNGYLDSNAATVTILVDTAPRAAADSYATNEDTALSVAAPGVLANDSDPDGDPIHPVLVSGPAHGTLQLNSDGSLVYTPSLHYSGPDSFQYLVSDGNLSSAVVTDTINVQFVNHPPVAGNDSYTVAENGSLSTSALPTLVLMNSQPGDYVGQGQSYDFTPSNSTITAHVLSGGAYTNAVEIDVTAPNNQFWTLDFAAPNLAQLTAGTYDNAVRWPFQTAGQPGLAVAGDGRGNNTLTGSFVVSRIVYDSSGNVVVFDATFTQYGENSTAALTGTVQFAAPGTPAGVLANDTDIDGQTLTAQLVAGPAHGTLNLSADGSFDYTPAPGYFGPDSFTYTASDGMANSNVVTATLTVNAPPAAAGQSIATNMNTPVPVTLSAADPDGDPVTYTLVSGPVHGALSGTAPNLTYTPAVGYTGPDRFTFEANDGTLDSNIAAVSIVVKATPTVTWNTPADLTYGTPLSSTQLDATATFHGIAVPGHFVYTPAAGTLLGAGANQALSALFIPDDTTDYNTATATTTINVLKATPTLTWSSPADITYGTPLGAAQLDATASVPGSFAYTPAAGTVLGAGPGQSLSVVFTPGDTTDYSSVTASTAINVLKATPTLTWSSPADITYGTPLGAAQLDATASVPGSFAYTPAAGTVLGAGPGQSLSVVFTPGDTTDYSSATASTTINVLKATPTVTWMAPASIDYGTPLGAAQLDATASVPGSFAYTPAAGTVLHAGSGQTLSAVFTPGDTVDYNTVTATTTIDVTRAHLTVTAGNQDMGHGDAVPALTASISGFVNGDTPQVVSGAPALSTTATSTSGAGIYPITAALGTLSAADYDFTLVGGTLTVHPKVLDIRVDWGNRSMSLLGLNRDLPFVNIAAIDVLFSDDVNVASNSLSLSSTMTGSAYQFKRFRYNSTTDRATWTLRSPLKIDQLLLALSGSLGAGSNPSISLWNNTPLNFAVLPGDYDGSGAVTNQDVSGIQAQESSQTPSIWADLNGSGYVDNTDVKVARRRVGTSLP